jgi:DNA-directed RNA polymerase specialized sigma24 family protein
MQRLSGDTAIIDPSTASRTGPHTDDPARKREFARIVHILRNLYEYLDKTRWPASHFGHTASRTREDLVCEMLDIKHAIPTLPPDLRRIISLIGLQGMDELHVALRLDISPKTVRRRLYHAAELIQLHGERQRYTTRRR